MAARLKQSGLHLDAITANGEVRHWLKDVANTRLHGTTQRQPDEQLLEERPHLQPIPAAWRGDIAAARPQAAPSSADAPGTSDTTRPAGVGERLAIPLPPQHPLAVYEQLLTQWRADLYSRKIVGGEVHNSDHADHAAHLVRRTALAEGIAALASKPVLHGDNGSTLKATTVLAMLNWLGVKPSYSRPRVSDDNAYAESLFRTAKYRPEFPAKGFANLDDARAWAARFVQWYNVEHRHSGIRYVSPAQRHAGEDQAILAARQVLYASARDLNPARWSGKTRNWAPVTVSNSRRCPNAYFSVCA